jgi:hypothetical protein
VAPLTPVRFGPSRQPRPAPFEPATSFEDFLELVLVRANHGDPRLPAGSVRLLQRVRALESSTRRPR